MKTINNYSVKNKNVLIRVDLNVPVVEGIVTDLSRVFSIKSTLNKLIKDKNRIFLLSHFGRPEGKYNKKLSLEFICKILKRELKLKKIYFVRTIDFQEIKYIQKNIKTG